MFWVAPARAQVPVSTISLRLTVRTHLRQLTVQRRDLDEKHLRSACKRLLVCALEGFRGASMRVFEKLSLGSFVASRACAVPWVALSCPWYDARSSTHKAWCKLIQPMHKHVHRQTCSTYTNLTRTTISTMMTP